MIYYTKEAVELLHLISEQKKGIPIITVFEAEAQSYKYGKETYYSVIKKQIEDAFEFTAMYVGSGLNISFDEYVGRYIVFPDDIAELNAINELLEHLKDDTIQKTQAPEPQRKQGRPKAEIHDASDYLDNKELLQFLVDNYSNTKPSVFNQLIKALIDLGQLKPASNKEYKEAFGNALNIKQSQPNFDNTIREDPKPQIFDPIKAKITTYLEQQRVV